MTQDDNDNMDICNVCMNISSVNEQNSIRVIIGNVNDNGQSKKKY